MSLGNTLRAAREANGMTTSELAARTHMLVQIVEGLENEDFRRIPAPIYGRGFIKLYCEAVNLDPKPLQTEFMDLFNRAKDSPQKKEMPPARPRPQSIEQPRQTSIESASKDPAASAATEQICETPTMVSAIESDSLKQPIAEPAESLFDIPAQTQDSLPATDTQPPPKRSYGDIFGQSYAAEEPRGQSAAEKFRNTMSNVSSGVFANVQKLPPNTGRIVTVSLCAILVLGIIIWGVLELYKATTPNKTPSDAPIATVKPIASSPKQSISVKPGDLKSTGIEIPSLYID